MVMVVGNERKMEVSIGEPNIKLIVEKLQIKRWRFRYHQEGHEEPVFSEPDNEGYLYS